MLENLKVGDSVLLNDEEGFRKPKLSLLKITKLLKLWVICDNGKKYRIETGKEVGDFGEWHHHPYIEPITPDVQKRYDKYAVGVMKEKIKKRLDIVPITDQNYAELMQAFANFSTFLKYKTNENYGTNAIPPASPK